MTIAHSQSGFAATGAERSVRAWLEKAGRAWANHRAYRATLAALNDLRDAQLSDLGIRRDALRSIARAAAYGN